MYLEFVARLKTITSAPNRIVLVLNPLPSRIKHVILLRNKLGFILKSNCIHPKKMKGNTSCIKATVIDKKLNSSRIPFKDLAVMISYILD